ncbi:hypothetical protein FIV42_29410 [Persicimonas caeni]|uniref:POTRA domain-containing protein n=1 Tax=Persicimonas caeni TaxID=2292766 RepID=A0A4Y6Q299_PERCE|nr:BamA/TamA family outer membrane protein [Persicimonas caeni]QDG54714.1 hypothetical protein FIV42_29410 [Persicimonas caeni]QED35935.1 BamA/TamA family outer membrane protein [Persicimonas caeni]
MTTRRMLGTAAALLAALVCLLSPRTGTAAGDGEEGAEKPGHIFVDTVTIEGLERTEPYVVRRELIVEEGETASVDSIEESVQRVRNTGLFRKVRYELVDVQTTKVLPEGVRAAALQISVDEKWTTLPIFSFNRGGGTYRLIVGAFDDNLLGHYIGVGGQYERLGEANSFYGWLYHPRMFGQRLRGGIDVGTQNRGYTLYDADGEVDGGFLLNRFTVGTYLRKEWLWWFRTQLSLRYVNDDFSYNRLSPTIEELQRERGLPPESHATIMSLSAMLGRIDQDNYLLDGTQFSVSLSHANENLGSTHTYTKLLAGVSHFETLPLNSNLAARLAAGTGDIDAIQHRFFLGGLDTVRGFANDRFAGEHYWLANLEYRIPSLDTRWVVLQHVVFADASGISTEFSNLAKLTGASTGIGLRFIVPKIQGFIARIDYALPLYGDITNPISLGGGQFY